MIRAIARAFALRSALLRNRSTIALTGLWLFALALRLAHVAELRHTAFFSVLVVDSRQYDAWAQQIAAGQWMGTGVFYQTPLYPYLLAVLYTVIGHNLLTVRMVQSILGASACVLLAIAGRRLIGPHAGLIAGLLLAMYPEAIFWDGALQKSSLDLFLMTLLLAALAKSGVPPSRSWIAAAGVITGAFILNRENAAVLVPVIAIWLVAGFRELPRRLRLARATLYVAGVAAVLVPIGIRNYAAGGEFHLSTAQLGPNFYIGNHSGASGTYEPLVADHGNPLDEQTDATNLAQAATGRTLSPAAVSNYWLVRAMDEVAHSPWQWLRLLGRKLLLTINAGEIVDTESMQEYARFSAVLRLFSWIGIGTMLPLAVLGVWIVRRNRQSIALLSVVWLSMTLAVALFFVVSRYRFPTVPVMLLFASVPIAAAFQRPVAWRSWIPGVVAAVIVGAVSHISMTRVSNVTFENVGAELARLGRPAEALPLLREATTIDPLDARAHYDLGTALEATGDRDSAFEEYQTAVRIRPDFAQARDAFGSALRAKGLHAEAVQQFAETVRLTPGSATAHLNYGVALWDLGQRDAAIAQYEEAVRLRPDDGAAHNNYAVALEALGRSAEAADHFRAAIERQPGNFAAHANYGDLLIRLGHHEDAVREYEQAARVAPTDLGTALSLLRRLADAYAHIGRMMDARETLKNAVLIAHAANRDDLAAELANASRAWR